MKLIFYGGENERKFQGRAWWGDYAMIHSLNGIHCSIKANNETPPHTPNKSRIIDSVTGIGKDLMTT